MSSRVEEFGIEEPNGVTGRARDPSVAASARQPESDGGERANASQASVKHSVPEADVGPRARATSIAANVALLATVIAATTAALWPTVSSLIAFWSDVYDYRFGFLIAAISLGWAFLIVKRSGPFPVRGSLWASAVLAIALFVWLIVLNANSVLAHQLLFPVVLWLAIYAAGGRDLGRALLAPAIFLFFAVPLWEQFIPILQWMSIHASEAILGILGVPADVSEYTVRIPEGVFHIIEGCSGKKFFMIGLAIAYLSGFVNGLSSKRLVILLIASGILAILANWLRIVIVIYAGHVTAMQSYFVAVEHRSLGNAIFVVLLIGITIMARQFSGARLDRPVSRQGPSSAGQVPASRYKVLAPFVLMGLAVLVVNLRAAAATTESPLGALPLAIGEWQGPLPPSASWRPHYVNSSDEVRATYTSGSGDVEIYVNTYARQEQGRELIYFRNTFGAPDGWRPVWDARRTPLVLGQRNSPVTVEMRAPDGSKWLLAYVYDIGGWLTTSEPLAQFAYGWRSLLRPVPAGTIAIIAPCGQNCEAARQLVVTFWDDMSPDLLAVMPDGTNR